MPAPAPSRTLVAEGAPRGGPAALCITQPTGWGALDYALSAVVRPISEDTDWDPVLVAGAFSAGLLVTAVAGIAVGRILDSSGPSRWRLSPWRRLNAAEERTAPPPTTQATCQKPYVSR
ncbi:MAG: major facilitator superfamily 1 [Arthrobacter sp.]|nr:major facilitator superfamily 1 [Arthrobacter sp.]